MSEDKSLSVRFDRLYLKTKKFSEYLYDKSSENKWKSGLISGTLLFFCGRYIYNKLYRKYYSLPPGPESILPQIGATLSTLLHPLWHINMAITYGSVVAFYEFNQLTVVINDSHIAKQVISNPNALDRDPSLMNNPNVFALLAAKDNTVPFIFLNGQKWFKMRQLMHTKLVRILNTKFVNKIVNESIKTELEPTLKEIISNNNGIWNSRKSLSRLTFNVMFYANFGEAVSFKNNKLCTELANDLDNMMHPDILTKGMLLKYIPRISAFIFPYSFFKPVYDIRTKISDNIEILIKQRNARKSSNSDDEKTFMDMTAELAAKNDSDYSTSQEIADTMGMFFAGTDTTATAIEWGLILLAKQANIQNTVRNELINVLSKNNMDYSEPANIVYDINLLLQLPLFRALIHEILRISCVVRLGVTHRNSNQDIWITTKDDKKYRLPKGSNFQYNTEYIHFNNKKGTNEHWKNIDKDPKKIYLENWLKDDNGTFYQNESFIVFGYGKRDCVGKQIAMKELRIIIGYLLLNYKFSLQPKYKNIKYIARKGGVRFGVSRPYPEIPVIVEPTNNSIKL